MLWTNDEQLSRHVRRGGDTSLNYLAATTLKTAGLPLNEYFAFLYATKQSLPAINLNGYMDAEGVWHWNDDADSSSAEAGCRFGNRTAPKPLRQQTVARAATRQGLPSWEPFRLQRRRARARPEYIKAPAKAPSTESKDGTLRAPNAKQAAPKSGLPGDRVNCLRLFLQVVEACGLATVKGHGLKVDVGDANEVGAVFLVVVVEVGLVLEVVRVEAAVRQGDVGLHVVGEFNDLERPALSSEQVFRGIQNLGVRRGRSANLDGGVVAGGLRNVVNDGEHGTTVPE